MEFQEIIPSPETTKGLTILSWTEILRLLARKVTT